MPMIEEEEQQQLPTYDAIPDLRMRFVDDVGWAFAVGLAGSSAFNLLTRGPRAVLARAPRAAGTLAAYFAVASAVDSALTLARGRKDEVLHGLAAAWAALGLRRGAPGAALIGFGWACETMVGRSSAWLADMEDKPQPQRTQPVPAAVPDGCFWAIPHGAPIVKEVPADGLGL